MQLSKGSLRRPRHMAMLIEAVGLKVSWVCRTSKSDSFVDDSVVVVVYNETAKVYDVEDNGVRADESITVDIDAVSGDVLHVWTFCVKRDEKEVSTSQYLGTITV